MNKNHIESKLFHKEREKAKCSNDLLEQYKLYVNSAEKISDRRQKTNEFFLGLNTALLMAFGFVYGKIENSDIVVIPMLVAGISICYFWYRIIRSYKGLNGAKFDIIHLIEKKLPLSLYDAEWEILGRGEDKNKYWPFSHVEIKIPWIFIIIYTCALLYVMLSMEILTYFYK